MISVFLEIRRPGTAHLASDETGTWRICGRKPQVGVDAAAVAIQGASRAMWLETMILHVAVSIIEGDDIKSVQLCAKSRSPA